MPLTDPLLWETIQQWPLPHRKELDKGAEPPRTCEYFEHNLRKRGDWTDLSASRITDMYRRFLYLKALSGEPIAPSEVIDMAWHLHLEFPADYAALCSAVGREIPHRTVYYENELEQAYERGRALYEAEFDRAPDRDLWSSGEDQNMARIWGFIGVVAWVVVCASSVILGGAVGGFWGFLLGAANILLFLAVAIYVNVRWGDVRPSKMARCA